MTRFGKSGKFVLSFVGISFALLLAELGLRIAGVSYPLFRVRDEELGWRLRPGISGWFGEEGGAQITINSYGFRDRERGEAKPPDTLRIAVLGDSFVQANEVDLESTFGVRLEERLRDCPSLSSRRAEVLNFGVRGYGTAQELLLLRRHVWRFSPDVVLLAFCPFNDVVNNSRDLEPYKMRPFFVFQNGDLVLDNSFRETEEYRAGFTARRKILYHLLDHSRVLQLGWEVLGRVSTFRQAASVGAFEGERAIADFTVAGVEAFRIYGEPADPAWENAWQVTESLISMMNREVRERGAEFWMVVVTEAIQVHPDPLVRQEFHERYGVRDLHYANRRLAALGEAQGFPVVTLVDQFQSYAEKEKVFLHGFENYAYGAGHWNEMGHRLAAEIVATELCSSLKF